MEKQLYWVLVRGSREIAVLMPQWDIQPWIWELWWDASEFSAIYRICIIRHVNIYAECFATLLGTDWFYDLWKISKNVKYSFLQTNYLWESEQKFITSLILYTPESQIFPFRVCKTVSEGAFFVRSCAPFHVKISSSQWKKALGYIERWT